MPDDALLQDVLERVADRVPVDWSAIDQSVVPAGVRQQLGLLQILDAMAGVHDAEASMSASLPTPVGTASVDASAPADGTAPATTWGRYRLDEPIGEGTFGRVYRAWDPLLQIPVAIKILHDRFTAGRLREELLREARALAQVQHPNVVRVLNVEVNAGRLGLCMEFLQGDTLDRVVQAQGPMNDRWAKAIGEDVCRALAAMHKAGFVHRDVKARNVMLERGGRVVLMDFGTGHRLEGDARPSATGTPLYMAPEWLAGRASATVTGDVYSMGVLLYFLTTGRYPYEAASVEDLLEAHQRGERQLLLDRRADLDPGFAEAVERALHPDPGQRHATAGALLDALTRTRDDARANRLAVALAVLGIVVPFFAMSGPLAAAAFDQTLGREGFVSYSVLDYLKYAASASVLPAVLAALAVVAAGMLSIGLRLALRSPAAGRGMDALRDTVRRTGLSHPSAAATLLVVLTAAAVIGIWTIYSGLLGALTSPISTAPATVLAWLSPPFHDYQTYYRMAVLGVCIASAWGWVSVARGARARRDPLHRGFHVVEASLLILAAGSAQVPYRLVNDTVFEAVSWDGHHCYVLGERGSDQLLFCPRLPPPRNRIVEKASPSLTRLGITEDIFTSFDPAALAPAAPSSLSR